MIASGLYRMSSGDTPDVSNLCDHQCRYTKNTRKLYIYRFIMVRDLFLVIVKVWYEVIKFVAVYNKRGLRYELNQKYRTHRITYYVPWSVCIENETINSTRWGKNIDDKRLSI